MRPTTGEEGNEAEIDHSVSTAFWDVRAQNAADPRSVTLQTDSIASVRRNVRRAQRWMFTRLDALGCRYEQVVDLACGNGDWTVVLAERARSLFAVDFAQGFVDATRERVAALGAPVQATFAQADLAEVVLPQACDLVLLAAVTQCLSDEVVLDLLRRVRGALRPDGHLYVRTTVAQHTDRLVTKTPQYQAIYRSRGFYEVAFADAGLAIVHEADTTDYMADEIVYQLLGRYGRPLAWPLRLIRRAYRRPRRHAVHVWILRPRG